MDLGRRRVADHAEANRQANGRPGVERLLGHRGERVVPAGEIAGRLDPDAHWFTASLGPAAHHGVAHEQVFRQVVFHGRVDCTGRRVTGRHSIRRCRERRSRNGCKTRGIRGVHRRDTLGVEHRRPTKTESTDGEQQERTGVMHVTLPQGASSRGGAGVPSYILKTSPTIGRHKALRSAIEPVNRCTAATYEAVRHHIFAGDCGIGTTVIRLSVSAAAGTCVRQIRCMASIAVGIFR